MSGNGRMGTWEEHPKGVSCSEVIVTILCIAIFCSFSAYAGLKCTSNLFLRVPYHPIPQIILNTE
jgi:hypothetical protein